MTPRRSLSTKERVRLFELHGGICHICGQKIDGAREPWEIEHVLARELGGPDTDENMKPAHVRPCHKDKTARDIGMIRKADRAKARHIGAKAPSRTPLPFSRGSRLKRKISGQVVAREER